ncbi:hypothetical protein NVP1111B_01 [Vibrio phage 1.111.B._10N.286.45.E6]|nr:hypothetical protein NVP1111A_01 [Vibrio phage 1.111.A._10N.286.45.E6]AUR88257.1 hypothetical protein NVP1111B_01 [Vibrio phage 1.111.B._10N.286.45.E6]
MKTYEQAKQMVESISLREDGEYSDLLDCIVIMESHRIFVDIAPDGIYQVTENIKTELSPELLYMMLNHYVIAPIKEIKADAEVIGVLIENGEFLKEMAITVMKELFTEASIEFATSKPVGNIH